MKKITIWGLAAVFALTLLSSEAWAGRVAKRQCRQGTRISQGVKSGQLTRAETRSLVSEQRRIQRVKVRSWSDGRLSAREKAHLELMQDRASHRIYKLKHNQTTR